MKKFLIILTLAVAAAGAWQVKRTLMPGDTFSNTTRIATSSATTHPDWAEKLSLAGVENFHRVSAHLYRGQQPTAEGMKNLAAMGIKTIVSLRMSDEDEDVVEELDTDLKLKYLHMPMLANIQPSDKQVAKFLALFADRQNLPVFVHCRHGADRTGTMCAMYRIVVEGWTKQQALDEMTSGGFGYHPMFDDLLEYIRGCDAAELAKTAGLTIEKSKAEN